MSAAVLAAAALFRVAGPDNEFEPELHARPVAAVAAVTAVTAPTWSANSNPSREHPISAEAMERAMSAADPGTRDRVLERMLTTWVFEDSQAAARCAEQQTDPFLREVALRTVAQRWAQIDHDAAVSWAASLGDDAERYAVIDAVALTMGDSDPRAALELLARRGADQPADATRAGIVTSWAARDFSAAQTWAEAQPPGPSRDVIVLRLAFLLAQNDPTAATSLANQMLGDETARSDAYASIFGPWVIKNPDAARAWAASADVETRRRVDAELAILETHPSPD